ncbi:hypothetical protein V8E54_009721 [Elaphomyces granulatus]
MLIPDSEVRLELEFVKQPPTTVSASALFPEPVIFGFEAFSPPTGTPSFWIPGPRDSLHFKAEFVSAGAGPSALGAVFRFPSNDVTIDVSSDDVLFLPPDPVSFWLSAVEVPGIYHLQVSGYRCVDGSRGLPLAQILSDPFEVTCKSSESSPPRNPRRTGPSARPPPTLRRF